MPERMEESGVVAVTRAVSPVIGRCELTHRSREPIDLELAVDQHRRYVELLAELGCVLRRLPAAPALPDSVFVEDTAVVLDEVAIVTRPGAPSRRPEVGPIAEILEEYRPLEWIRAPGRLDGGDVLAVGRRLFVGRSTRSDEAGIRRLAELTEPLGYRVTRVQLDRCLHLKSAATRVGPETVLADVSRVDREVFRGLEVIEAPGEEPDAANALWLQGLAILPAGFVRTRERLESRGIPVRTVEVSELAKAEGGVTCCSLIFPAAPGVAG